MKKIILYIFLSISILSHSQDRSNFDKLKFSRKSLLLTTAVGWCLDEYDSGEWISTYNCIDGQSRRNNNIPIRISNRKMSLSNSNFITMQFAEIEFNKELYYILLIEKWEGYFEYPSIGEGWIFYKTKHGYVFNNEEYHKILNLENGNEVILTPYNKVASSGEACLTQDILMSLKNDVFNTSFNNKDLSSTDFFSVLKTGNGKIRFHIPNGKYPKKIAIELNKERVNYLKIASHNINDFDNEYFETSQSNFNKIILQ